MSLKTPFTISGLTIVLFSSLFLCSCGSKKSSINLSASRNQNRDLIIPLGFQCIEKLEGPVSVARYRGTQSCERVIAFYCREMEAAGWDLSNFSHDREGLFFCRKGRQECAISICCKNKTIITIIQKTKVQANARFIPDVAQINRTPRRFE